MSIERIPSSLDGIKRRAKAIKATVGITHQQALETAAKKAGFSNYTHARKHYGATPGLSLPGIYPPRPSRGSDDNSTFRKNCCRAWMATLDQLNPAGLNRMEWEGGGAVRQVLEKVLGHTRSHAHLPTGGGQDFNEIRTSTEAGCLEFQVEGGSVYIARPKRLILERLAAFPEQSFLLLELGDLAPSGVYDLEPRGEGRRSRHERTEELVEIAPGKYLERYVWDQGFLGHDSEEREIPLPAGARLVVRWLDGQMLFVTKGSLWNGDPATYDGRHDQMSADTIRRMIERSMTRTL